MSAAADREQTLTTRLVTTVSALAAQAGLLTALLYYFGWTRTRASASMLGLDPSLFGYSTQEYVLRSVDSMVIPVGIGLLALVGGRVSAEFAIAAVREHAGRARRLRRALTCATAAGGLAVVWGSATMLGLPAWRPTVSGPATTLAGAVLTIACLGLARRLRLHLPVAPLTDDDRPWRTISLLLAAIAMVSVFALTAAYADTVGRRRAADYLRSFGALPEATVVSTQPLDLAAYPGVTVERRQEFADDPPSRSYRYRGLKLLAKAGGTYYLLPSDLASDNAVTIALPDDDGVRLEFDWSPARTPPPMSP